MMFRTAVFAVVAASLSPMFMSCTSTADEASPPEAATPESGMELIDAVAAAKLLSEDSNSVVLDIRTPEEYERGHIEGAINIDYRKDDFAERLQDLDKGKTYVMH